MPYPEELIHHPIAERYHIDPRIVRDDWDITDVDDSIEVIEAEARFHESERKRREREERINTARARRGRRRR